MVTPRQIKHACGDRVENALRKLFRDERSEALGYSILIVLATPVFVALAAALVALTSGVAIVRSDLSVTHFDAQTFYTATSLFLAYMIVFVLLKSSPSRTELQFHKPWIAAVVLFGLLLALTYGTSWVRDWPAGFGVIYAVLGLFVLGLLGHVDLLPEVLETPDEENALLALILACSGFIIRAYGEVGRGSWLWVPPGDDEIKIGAWLLRRMASDPDSALSGTAMHGRIMDLLIRLRLIGVTEAGAALTPKGLEFIHTAMAEEG